MTVNNKIAKPKRVLSNADRERLGKLLRRRLIECGWKDQVRILYHQVMRECAGQDVTFETIISKMTPRAHALVPDVVKKEFIKKIIECRGPRILNPVPKPQNQQADNNDAQGVQEVPQMQQLVAELAQAVPQGVYSGPIIAPGLQQEQQDPELEQQVPHRAQEVPHMEQ